MGKNRMEIKALEIIRDNKYISNAELAEELGISFEDVKIMVLRLKSQVLISETMEGLEITDKGLRKLN